MTTLKIVHPSSKPERATHTTVDTIVVTPELIKSWLAPPFQRPLKVNPKLQAIVEQIKSDGGVLPGVITLGCIGGKTFIVDGQHRIHAFDLSAVAEGFADVRTCHFKNFSEMAEEFVAINSKIVQFKPDDVLRGLEMSLPALQIIRRECRYVGYDMIRRNNHSPILSMSVVLRMWSAASSEVPITGGTSAAHRAQQITEEEAVKCSVFLNLADKAWGRDHEYARLWGLLNLTICAWIYRRIVLSIGVSSAKRATKLTSGQYAKGMMGLSADPDYSSWLVGRALSDRDRSPAYSRVRALMIRRLAADGLAQVKFPAPEWSTGK